MDRGSGVAVVIRATVPTKLIAPIVKRYLEQYEMEDLHWSARKRSPLIILANECGIHQRRLHRILSGETEEVHFDVADMLLCKMGLVMLWYAPPLSDIYWSLDLTEYAPARPKKVVPARFNCGHEQTKENTNRDLKRNGRVYQRCRRCYNERRRERRTAA